MNNTTEYNQAIEQAKTNLADFRERGVQISYEFWKPIDFIMETVYAISKKVRNSY